MMDIDTIIWDWNGTLLDDAEISIEVINVLLADRNLPLLNKEQYLGIFGFPVKKYYENIGFDFEKESFEIPAHQYIEKYSSAVIHGNLHKQVHEILAWFSHKGYKQLVLSASEQASLEMLLELFNIKHWFSGIAGLDNHYAQSKEKIGIQLLKQHQILPEKAILIGDTLHDFEVAQAMGCKCLLVANGHQSFDRLNESGTMVLHNLNELEKYFRK